ncbi:MAG: hypothetical protein WCW13_04265 [archaeon]|jgi:hypothetical protein
MSKKLRNVEKGFVFTLEAGVSIMLFGLMLFCLPQTQNFTLKELAIIQQADDLLRVWSAQETNESEMISDTNKLFGEAAEVWVNSKQLSIAQKKLNVISAEGAIVDLFLRENMVKVLVYYD